MKTLLLGIAIGAFSVSHNLAMAQVWTQQTNAPALAIWTSMASSADGSRLVATTSSQIYTSANSGVTWTRATNAPQNQWNAVASSADGSRLVAVSYLNTFMIYVSTNWGTTWNAATNAPYPAAGWQKVALSGDGKKIVATGQWHSGMTTSAWIATSADSGNTWKSVTNGPGLPLSSIAASADGTRLVAVAGGYDANISGQVDGAIYVSTNSGDTWTQTTAPDEFWTSVASSADGTKLVAVQRGTIYTSINSGDNWAATGAPVQSWRSVASSADGTRLVALSDGAIYTSTDSGAGWTSNDVPNQNWVAAVSSADGFKLLAIAPWSPTAAAQIYDTQSVPTPALNLAPAGGQVTLSWIIPSTDFVLQQSPDLIAWMDLTNTPVLNLTNLQNQVILSPPFGEGFYRLKSQ